MLCWVGSGCVGQGGGKKGRECVFCCVWSGPAGCVPSEACLRPLTAEKTAAGLVGHDNLGQQNCQFYSLQRTYLSTVPVWLLSAVRAYEPGTLRICTDLTRCATDLRSGCDETREERNKRSLQKGSMRCYERYRPSFIMAKNASIVA